jgi:hypothetical protein
MIITRQAVISANQPYIPQYIPRFDGESQNIFDARLNDRILISAPDVATTLCKVRFISSLVWVVAGQAAIPIIGKILLGLFDTPVSTAVALAAPGTVGGLVLNGATVPEAKNIEDALDAVQKIADQLTLKQFDTPRVSYIVPGKSPTDRAVQYSVKVEIVAVLVTTRKANEDDRLEEQANIERATLKFQDQSVSRPYFNVNLNLPILIEDSFEIGDFPPDSGQFEVELSVAGLLRTAGGYLGSTTSLVRVKEVTLYIREKPPQPPATVAAPVSDVVVPQPSEVAPTPTETPGPAGPAGPTPAGPLPPVSLPSPPVVPPGPVAPPGGS